MKLVLASRSPQRRAILAQLGIEFEVRLPEVEEQSDGDPRLLVRTNALAKARAVTRADGETVLGADTAVVLDGRVYGKAAGEDEARRFLQRLCGRTHEVISGIALVDERERTEVAIARVKFRVLEQASIDWYLATGEWRERAGAYAIQGQGAALVERIDGDFWNVVGLPVAALLDLEPALLRTHPGAGDYTSPRFAGPRLETPK